MRRRRLAVTRQPRRGWWGCDAIHTSSFQLSLPSKLKGRGHHSHSSRRDLEAPWGCSLASSLFLLSHFEEGCWAAAASAVAAAATITSPPAALPLQNFASPIKYNVTQYSCNIPHREVAPGTSRIWSLGMHAKTTYGQLKSMCVLNPLLPPPCVPPPHSHLLPCGCGLVAAPKICMYES